MKGIYFINDRISLNGLSKEESLKLQEQTMLPYIQKSKIEMVKLNPYQLHNYYTIPHALLYDLKKHRDILDCFILYSPEIMDDFINSYPSKWLILKSFFNEIVTMKERKDHPFKFIV